MRPHPGTVSQQTQTVWGFLIILYSSGTCPTAKPLSLVIVIVYGSLSHPGIDDLVDIGEYLVNLKKDQIFRLGLVLGLRAVPTLDIIKDSPTFIYDMLTAWLQGQDGVGRRGGHTWGALVKGLKHPTVSQNETADKIEMEKCH